MARKREPNKKRILEKLKGISSGEVETYLYDKVNTISKKCVKNAKLLISKCEDDELEDWDVAAYANGSILFTYCRKNGITAIVNIAEMGASGVFAFRNLYNPIQISKFDDIDKIIDIFKSVRENVNRR